MKKLFILTAILFGLSNLSRAQYSMDFGLNLGASIYTGEIGEPGLNDKFYENPFPLYIIPDYTRYNVGLFYRYNFTKNIAARVEANWVRISGADSLSDTPERIARNLSFRTDIAEISLMGEYAWLTKLDISRKQRIDFRATVFAGVGYMLYYPQAQLDDKWYSLRPLATEGIDNEYSTGSLIVPFGAGFDYTFNKKIRVGMDLTYRFTFTDYLDDISTDYAAPSELPYAESIIFADRSAEAYERGNPDLPPPGFYGGDENNTPIRGNPESNDGYFMLQFKVSYVLDLNNSFYKARYRSVINRRRKRTKF